MKINKHGLKMVGLKAASGETVNWEFNSGGHVQISYNMVTGEIYTDVHIGNSWSEYRNANIITICHTSEHMTMQQIADRIAERVTEERNDREWYRQYLKEEARAALAE